MMAPQEREEYIVFADPVVGQICATNWGDGVGITPSQAARVTDIGTKFYNNANITSFKELLYFTGITTLPANAFQYCTSLTTIGIPKNVTSSASTAFSNMRSITSIYIEDLDKFLGITWAAQAAHPFGGDNIHTGTLYLNDVAVTSVSYPSTIASISAYSLLGCSNVTSITVPSSVTSIGDSAFKNCTSLGNMTIPSSVTTLGGGEICMNCSSITNFICNSTAELNTSSVRGAGNNTGRFSTAGNAKTGYVSAVSSFQEARIGGDVVFDGNRAFGNVKDCRVTGGLREIAVYSGHNLMNGSNGKTEFIEIGGSIAISGKVIAKNTGLASGGCILHLKYNGVACTPTCAGASFARLTKVYVDSQAVLDQYLADSNWSAYASKLDLWSNYNGPYKNA